MCQLWSSSARGAAAWAEGRRAWEQLLVSGLPDEIHCRLRVAAINVADYHLGAVLRKQNSGRLAHALAAAGDDSHLRGQLWYGDWGMAAGAYRGSAGSGDCGAGGEATSCSAQSSQSVIEPTPLTAQLARTWLRSSLPGSKLKHCSWKAAAVTSRETASELHVWSARWPASTATRLLEESIASNQEDSALDGGSGLANALSAACNSWKGCAQGQARHNRRLCPI